jgi:glucose/arabinose dehydrogenase
MTTRSVRARARRRQVFAAALAVSVAAVLMAAPHALALTASGWPVIGVSSAISGLTEPTYVTGAGDGSGRLFLVQRGGLIHIYKDGAVLPTPFMDVSGLVTTGGSEQGLLGLAFPPSFATTGTFYIDYTDTNSDIVVARYGLSTTDTANPASAQQVLKLTKTPGRLNHNGGQLAFGPDGYLYVAVGDGGLGGDPDDNAQNKDVLFGKILRLDAEASGVTTYQVPPTNPFVGVTGADEIWAYGLRNPWRFSFDRQYGSLFIGDVGQGEWEEIDFQSASSAGGENYGWRLMEGNHPYPPGAALTSTPTVRPVAEYAHTLPGGGLHDGNGCAVTGGYIYRGGLYPELRGTYLYADYCLGKIYGLRRVAGTWRTTLLKDTDLVITTFGQSDTSELYVADYSGGGVYRVKGQAVLTRPVLVGTTSPLRGRNFTVRGSILPEHPLPGSTPLFFYRRIGTRWVYTHTRSASHSDGGYFTRWSLTTRLFKSGAWMVKARHADSAHLLTVSAPATFIVR